GTQMAVGRQDRLTLLVPHRGTEPLRWVRSFALRCSPVSERSVRVVVETLAEQRILEAILHWQIARQEVEIDSGWTTSGAIARAQAFVLDHLERPVALVLNTHSTDWNQVENLRGTAQRLLSWAGTSNWHVALAIPRMDAWAKADPRIREAFEKDERLRDNY